MRLPVYMINELVAVVANGHPPATKGFVIFVIKSSILFWFLVHNYQSSHYRIQYFVHIHDEPYLPKTATVMLNIINMSPSKGRVKQIIHYSISWWDDIPGCCADHTQSGTKRALHWSGFLASFLDPPDLNFFILLTFFCWFFSLIRYFIRLVAEMESIWERFYQKSILSRTLRFADC